MVRAERWEKVPEQKKCSNEYDGGEFPQLQCLK